MEPQPKKISAIEFAKEKLQLNPEATYADIKAQAKFEGIALFPVVYGRAKALLGLVPTAPYGSKSKARRESAESTEPSRPAVPAARPAAAAPNAVTNGASAASNGTRTARAKAAAARTAASADSLEAMISDLRSAVQERDRYRAVLEKVAELIRAELAG